MEMIIGMIKIMTLNNENTISLCECFNCLPFSFRNHFSKKTFFRNAIRAPNSLDSDQIPYFGGSDLGSKCLQSRISCTELNVTISINAINYYLLRGPEPDCLFL